MTVRSMTLRRLLKPSTLSVARTSLHKQLGASSLMASSSSNNSNTSTRSFASSSEYVLSEREQEFHAKGWMDERGLTLFKTLHENQVRSCEVYADNELYGNYNPETNQFDYKTFRDFGQQVNRARTVLQDLGMGVYILSCFACFCMFVVHVGCWVGCISGVFLQYAIIIV